MIVIAILITSTTPIPFIIIIITMINIIITIPAARTNLTLAALCGVVFITRYIQLCRS